MRRLAFRTALTALLLTVGCDPASGEDAGPHADADTPVDAGPSGDGGPRVDAGPDAGPPNLAPTAAFERTREVALELAVDASASSDADGAIESYTWDFGDGQTGAGVTASHTYAAAGCYDVSLLVTDDGGATGSANHSTRILASVAADAGEFSAAGMPTAGALLPRDLESNAATVTVRATAPDLDFERLALRVYVDDVLEAEASAELCGDDIELAVPVAASLAARRLELAFEGLGETRLVDEVDDIVAGDFLVVQGQSNAVSAEFEGSADENLGDFVRSFGTRSATAGVSSSDNSWYRGRVGGGSGDIGQWPLRMAALLSAQFEVPIAVLNGAHGGQPIGFFQRDDADVVNAETNYGRLLRRVQASGAEGNVRAILFYQGESDGDDATAHHDGFVALHEDWQEDFAEVERFYVTQIRRGCGGGRVEIKEVQRQFATELPRTSLMSTTGLDGHDGCHYAYAGGYRELGDRYAGLLARDLYGADPQADTEPVDVAGATVSATQIVIETSGDASALVVDEGVEAFFSLRGTTLTVASVSADGTQLVLGLDGSGEAPTHVAFDGHIGSGAWVTNAAGVGLLTFLLELP